MMHHLNNAAYVTFFEYGRLFYFLDILQWDFKKTGNVVASIGVDFKIPIFPQDNVYVYVRCSSIGNKSFILEYLLAEKDGEDPKIFATCNSTQVCINISTSETISMPDEFRKKIIAFEKL